MSASEPLLMGEKRQHWQHSDTSLILACFVCESGLIPTLSPFAPYLSRQPFGSLGIVQLDHLMLHDPPFFH